MNREFTKRMYFRDQNETWNSDPQKLTKNKQYMTVLAGKNSDSDMNEGLKNGWTLWIPSGTDEIFYCIYAYLRKLFLMWCPWNLEICSQSSPVWRACNPHDLHGGPNKNGHIFHAEFISGTCKCLFGTRFK